MYKIISVQNKSNVFQRAVSHLGKSLRKLFAKTKKSTPSHEIDLGVCHVGSIIFSFLKTSEQLKRRLLCPTFDEAYRLCLKNAKGEEKIRMLLPDGQMIPARALTQLYGIDITGYLKSPEHIQVLEGHIRFLEDNPDKRRLYIYAVLPNFSVCEMHEIMDKGKHNSIHKDGKFYDNKFGKAWFQDKKWANEKPEVGSILMLKHPPKNSFKKTWPEQQAVVPKRHHIPSAGEVIRLVCLFKLFTGKNLLKTVYLRTNTEKAAGYRVYVGFFDAVGLFVYYYIVDYQYVSIGVVFSRRQSC